MRLTLAACAGAPFIAPRKPAAAWKIGFAGWLIQYVTRAKSTPPPPVDGLIQKLCLFFFKLLCMKISKQNIVMVRVEGGVDTSNHPLLT